MITRRVSRGGGTPLLSYQLNYATGKLIRMDSTTKVLITQSDKFHSQCNNLSSTDGEIEIETGEKAPRPVLLGKYILDVMQGSSCTLIQIDDEEFVTSIRKMAQRIRDAIGVSEEDLKNIISAAQDKLLELATYR